MEADEKLLLSRVGDMVKLSEKRGADYSMFLSSAEQSLVQCELLRLGHSGYSFCGGFENAERKMLCVYREYFEPADADFPMEILTFKFREGEKLTHRDFLGAFMALMIKRETIGDIVIGEGIAQAAVCSTVGSIVGSVKKIGSCGVKLLENYPGLLTRRQEYREIIGTAASLRLDSIAGLALKMSRSKTAELIRSQGIEVGLNVINDCSFEMKEGDVFSVRGHGKYRLSEISGVTKKGRIHVTVLKYC